MNSEALDFIKLQLSYLIDNQENIIIDTDTHISDFSKISNSMRLKLEGIKGYFQGKPISAEDLLLEMDSSGVDMALTWQNPACIDYLDDKSLNYDLLMAANTYIFESSRKYPYRFIPAGWVDPKALGVPNCLKILDKLVLEYGFPIVKMNPAQNGFFLDSDEVFEVVDRIVALNAVPAFHIGSDTPFTPVAALEKLAKRYREHPIVAVHMGGGGAGYMEAEENYHQIRKVGLNFSNLKFPLSAKRDTHIETDILFFEQKGEPFNQNLFFASDAPYGKQSWNIGGFKSLLNSMMIQSNGPHSPALIDESVQKRILGSNFCKFIITRYQMLLEKYAAGVLD